MDDETVCIHRLSAELLAKIFSLSLLRQQLSSSGRSSRITRAYQLSITCKKWKAIIEGCPRLWTFVTPLDGPLVVAKALALSIPHPIHISCPTSLQKDPKWFMKLIAPYTRRWHSAVLTPPTSHFFLQILRPCPIKDHLLEPEHDNEPWIEKFGLLSLPRERLGPNLASDEIPVLRWNGEHLAGLRTMELNFSPQTNRSPYANPTVSEILTILSNCPRLQSLTCHLMVTEYEMEWAATERNPNLPVVDLPTLRHLSLTAPPTYSASLLSGICLPTIPDFALSCCGGEPTDLEAFLSSVQHRLQASIDKHVNSTFVVDAHLQYTQVNFQLKALSFDNDEVEYRNVFSISFVKASVADAIDAIGTVLKDITIEIDHTTVFAESMQDALHQGTLAAIDELPRVTSMVLENCDVEWLLQVLTVQNGFGVYPDEETYWMFPLLKELEMRCCIFAPRYVLRMVQGRFGSQQRNNGNAESPVWFEKLKIVGQSDQTWIVSDDLPRWMVRDIRAVFGNGVLEWEAPIEDGSDHDS